MPRRASAAARPASSCRSRRARLAQRHGAGAQPRHSLTCCPSRIRSPRRRAPPACRSSATSSCWRAPQPEARYRRHHRHQRQVDHHRADRPHPATRRLAGRGRRQYRHAGARLDAARAGRHLCARDVVLPARAGRRRSALDVAVLLNITPDHLDRHGGMAGYVAAKRRIFDRQAHERLRRSSASTTSTPPTSPTGCRKRAPGHRRRADRARAHGRRRRLRPATAS